MSELKALHAFDVYDAYTKTGDDDAAQVYLKSEADKVIAEKDEEIYNIKYSRDEWAKACNQKDKEIAELEAMNQDLCERVTENDEIRLHWEEIEQTRAENERMKSRIAELEDERRWRKCCEEMPKIEEGVGEIFLVVVENESNTSPKGSYVTIAELCDGEWYNDVTGNEIEENIEGSDYFYRSKVTHWMPLPSAPKEEK